MSTTVSGLLDGQFTLGVEEEFQIVHPETRELRSYVSQLLEEGGKQSLLRERVRPEMHQSVVETGTGICRDIRQARSEICELRSELNGLASKHGLRIVAAGDNGLPGKHLVANGLREGLIGIVPGFDVLDAVVVELRKLLRREHLADPASGGHGVGQLHVGVDLDLNVAMTVSLEEAAKGAEKRVRLPTGKELNVKIPAGVTSGQQIRLKGQGESAPGHRPGDLLITVTVAPHPFFKVEGSDLRVYLPVTLYEAVLGGKVHIQDLLPDWVLIHQTAMDMMKYPSTTWLNGTVRGRKRPLSVTFDYPQAMACGKVLYSSYHTREHGAQSRFPNYCAGGKMIAQEHVLEYLIFELSSCVGPIG